MPLLERVGSGYIKRTRVYLSNQDRATGTDFSYGIALKDQIQNVVGIELISYQFDKRLAPTFRGRYTIGTALPYASASNDRRTSPPGNMMVDIQVTNETNTTTMVFTLDLELIVPALPAVPYSLAGRTLTPAELATQLQTAIPLALDAAGSGTLNTSNYDVNTGIDSENRFFLNLSRVGAPGTFAEVIMLFETGANASDSMHRVLGFETQEDTTPDAATDGVQAAFSVDVAPIRYVDVFVRQFPELNPHSRIYLTQGDFVRSEDYPNQPRFLTEPVTTLTRLDVTLTFNREQSPNTEADQFHDLGFEILSVEPEMDIPNWVEQKDLV